MPQRSDVAPESLARYRMSIPVLQNRAFIELSRILAGGDSAVLSSTLPAVVRGACVPSAVVYGFQKDDIAFLAAEGVPLKLRAYLEETGFAGAKDFIARRALRQRRTVIDSAIFGDIATAGALSALDEAGWQSGIAVPILAGGKSLGVILAGARSGTVDGGTVTFLESMANLLGAALGKQAPSAESEQGMPAAGTGSIAHVCEAITALGRDVAAQQAMVRQICFRRDPPPEADALLTHSRAVDRSFHRLSDVVLHLPGASGSHVRKSVSLASVLQAAVRAAEQSLAAARVNVELDCHPSSGFEGDAELITLAVKHLIVNAAEALATTSEDPSVPSSRRRVQVRAQCDDPHAVIEVEDSGPGVPLDLWPRVFDPSVTTKGPGRGLGLALAHHVVESHGGRMELTRSTLGGARFRIFLPLRSPSLQELRRAPTLPQFPAPPRALRHRAGNFG
jgi:signal transduction histidine kinase